MTAIYTEFFHFPILTYRLAPRVVARRRGSWPSRPRRPARSARVRRTVRAAAGRGDAARTRRRLTADAGSSARGLRRWLSQPTRIVLRNLQRHPARAALSTLGIAFGGAMLIVATFTIDAMDDMIDTAVQHGADRTTRR